MRILMISTLFPPFVQGGAICAHNLATWLVGEGHDVSILTTAPTPDDEVWDEEVEGYRLFRISVPRAYTVFDAANAPGWKKPLWHGQDLFDPRNKTPFERVLDVVQPDFVNVQYVQGLGYNGLRILGQRDLPVVFTLHDLGLACIKMSMFTDGKECAQQCTACRASAKVKMGYLGTIRRLGFISPSMANLDKLRSLLPIGDYPCHRVLNANEYPTPTVGRNVSDSVRILYVGRLHRSKGVDVVLQALDRLSESGGFTLDILGSGPDEAEWRARYGDRDWIRFAGHVSQQQVADRMADSDLLLVPSIWLENSPGVVIQALSLGLPVMGSRKGGIPELVRPDENGFLVEPGDPDAWTEALRGVIAAPAQLERLRARALSEAEQFSKPHLARQALAVFEEVMSG